VHGHYGRRHRALHIHLDTSNRMHWNIYDQHDLGHVFAEGNLLYQQRGQRQ